MKLVLAHTVLLALLLCSCDKTKSKHWTEVKITVQNDITGEPIEDAYSALKLKRSNIRRSINWCT